MSRRAIAAALAREDLASGERLAAFSLASFADRGNRAWPGASAAALRAGLSRSRYLQAREQLVRRDLVLVEHEASGRGRSTTLALAFAEHGPWWEGEINVELFEAVLGYSSAGGPARLLLAAMAAVADAEGDVRDFATEQLCAAAGVADRTYRRARKELLSSGELVLLNSVGGRGNTNVWTVPDPRQHDGAEGQRAPRRVTPSAGARPLVAAMGRSVGGGLRDENGLAAGVKGGHAQAVSVENRPVVTGVSDVKGGQDRTLFELPVAETPAERAAQTPAETPAPNARAGKEPQNPRTLEHPPNPPEGGRGPDSVIVERTYVTERGRTRRRTVRVDLAEVRRGLGIPTSADHADWQRIRSPLTEAVGETTFAIWLEPLQLIAIDNGRALVVAAPSQTLSWVRQRFGRLLTTCAQSAGREIRLADESERAAIGIDDHRPAIRARTDSTNQKEAS